MKKILLLLTAIGMYFLSLSQNELDALRFSQIYYFGTSRTMGMAGAFSALGADPGSYVVNPAALGLTRYTDYSISTGFKMNHTYSTFNGTSTDDIKYNFIVNNLSLVWANKTGKQDLKYFNFAFTYNRINDFNHRLLISGVNDKGSMLDYFTYLANGYSPDRLNPFSTYLAYNTYLIDPIDTINWIYAAPNMFVYDTLYGETQRKLEETSGSGGSYDFGFALNFWDKVFVGMSFSSVSMKYESNSSFTESNFPDSVELSSFTFSEILNNKVSGYAVKAGVTLVPVKFLRVSLAAHSPYFLKVTDLYHSSIDSHWLTPDADGNYDYYDESDLNEYHYKITTPLRITGGVGLLVGKMMALDLEYEYVDYKLIRMSAPDYTFDAENSAIRENFNTTQNIRAGAELNLGGFQLRGGIARYGAAYGRVSDTWVYAGGLGFRASNVYFDLAFNYRFSTEDYWFYIPYVDEPTPSVTYKDYYVAFTIGYKLR